MRNYKHSNQSATRAVRHAEVAEFMVTSLDGSAHPALLATPGSGVIVNAQTSSVEPESLAEDVLDNLAEIYQPCIFAQEDFIATANKQRRKLKQPEFIQTIPCRWSEVGEVVISTCNELEQMAEATDKNIPGSMGRLKSGFRKLCKHIEKGETFVSLIPDDTFGCGSTLRGALGIVFSALKGTGAHRTEVYNTLEELPLTLTDRVANIKWFQHDEELHRRTAALFASIFRLLKHILSWLVQGTLVTGLKTLANPSGLVSGLLACRKEVNVRSEQFRSHAANLTVAFQRNFDQFALVRQENNFSEIGAMLLGMDEASQTSRSEIMSILTEVAARAKALEAFIPLFLSSHEATKQRMLENPPQLQASPQGLDSGRTVNEILEEHAYDVDLIYDDVEYLLGVISRPGRRAFDQNRLYAIQSSSILRAWALVDEPSLLLIHSRDVPRPESAVSLASAQIVSQMLQSIQTARQPSKNAPFIIPVAFFCGQHQGRGVPSGPSQLMLNLLLQLLDRGRHVMSFEALENCWEDMEAGDINSIRLAFENLVSSLCAHVFVLVVVDGISFYSRTAKDREETRSVIATFVDMQREQRTEATIKVLFTSPLRPQFVEELFTSDEVLNMPRNIALRGRNSNLDWDFPIGPGEPDEGGEQCE